MPSKSTIELQKFIDEAITTDLANKDSGAKDGNFVLSLTGPTNTNQCYVVTIKTVSKPGLSTLKSVGGKTLAQVVVDSSATWDVSAIQQKLKESHMGSAGFVKQTIP